MTDDRKAKIARLRKIVKGVCSSLRVRRGRGTAYSWVNIQSDSVDFTVAEKKALDSLCIPHGLNYASIAPEDLDAVLRWLEDRGYGAKARQENPPADDMILVTGAAAISIAQRNVVERLTEPEPFCACGRRLSECDGSRAGCGQSKQKPRPKGWRVLMYEGYIDKFAISDEHGNLIADCYSNQEDALAMAASRELLAALKDAIVSVRVPPIRAACEAAIAKAEGGKS